MELKGFKKIISFIILPIAFLSIFAVSHLRWLDNYELETLDLRFLLRPAIKTTDKVVFIEIAEDTFEKLGMFPFDRNYHALIVKALSEAKAKYIFFDVFFSEPQKSDKELEEAIESAANVYLPYALEINTKRKGKIITATGYRAKSIEGLRLAARGEGHINIIEDVDGKFRKIPVYIGYKNTYYPFVSFLMACDYLGIHREEIEFVPGKYIACANKLKVPLDENSNMLINFSGKWGRNYKHYSYIDVLQSYLADVSAQKPILDLNIFKDKICIIGLTAAGSVDLHPSPYQELYPAVGIHAEVFNSVLNKKFISRAGRGVNLLILAVLAAITCLITLKTKPIKGLLFSVSLMLIFIVFGILLFDCLGLWIDLFYPTCIIVIVYLSFTMYKYVSEWKKRLIFEEELDIAKQIQKSFLPKEIAEVAGLDISAAMFTARQVGGDLYDFVEFDREKLGVMIGDVSGKGIPASLFMAMAVGAFRSFTRQDVEPKDTLCHLNNKLIKEASSGLFVTVFYSIFDMQRSVFIYANGGHMPVLYLTKGKKAQPLDVDNGMPLGVIESSYSGGSLNFRKGDIFVYYTDGVTEAKSSKLELYGKERLIAVLEEANQGLSAKAILEAIAKEVRKFEPKARQHDDITLIVVKVV